MFANILKKLNVLKHFIMISFQLAWTHSFKNSLQTTATIKAQGISKTNALVSKLEKRVKISHSEIYMHGFLEKYKHLILVLSILAISTIVLIGLSWYLIIRVANKNEKVDTISIETKTSVLNKQRTSNEVELKKQELENISNDNARLSQILEEKQAIYTRLLELQNEPWTPEQDQLETRNIILTQESMSISQKLSD